MNDSTPHTSARRFLDLPWRRLVAEFVVIVVGVAVGLAVDSAREARGDAERASEHLMQIRDELAITAAAVEAQIARSRAVAEAAERLLEGINQPDLPPADTLRDWWSDMFVLGTYRPSAVAIDALVESGDVRLIDDLELRRAVLAYRDQTDVGETAGVLVDELINRALARIGEDMSLANLAISPRDVRHPLNWEGAAGDPAFHSQVLMIRVSAASIVQGLTALGEAASELRDLIEAALPSG